MEPVTDTVRSESLDALRSAVRKSEAALEGMSRTGANVTLIGKRLRALRIALAVLEETWNHAPHAYAGEELAEAREVLAGLMLSVQASFAKSRDGSPQRTLLTRRIRSLELAVQAIDERLPEMEH